MSDKVQEALGRVISSGGQKKGRNQRALGRERTLVRDWVRRLSMTFETWAARDSNPARRIKSPELYQMS
jgi:hypothetical protein